MNKTFKVLLAVTLAGTPVLAAQAVTFGTPNVGQGDCFPFGCPSFHNQFEQVYSSTGFTDPLTISSISFYNSIGTGVLGYDSYSVYLSQTTANPASLSDTPSANITGPETLFGSYVANGDATGSVFTLSGTGFNYDPTLGNLLLDIKFTVKSYNQNIAYFDLATTSTVGVVSDESPFAGDDDMKGKGLVTTFNLGSTAAVTPEPATMTLMAIGLVGMMPAFGRRKRRG